MRVPCTCRSLHLCRDSLRLGQYFSNQESRHVTVQNVATFYLDKILSPKLFLSPRNVTVQNVMPFYPDKMLSPKNFLSPRNVTVQNVMPFYPDIIMSPKFWLSPRNVTLENVTTYFVRQMNRPRALNFISHSHLTMTTPF